MAVDAISLVRRKRRLMKVLRIILDVFLVLLFLTCAFGPFVYAALQMRADL